MDSTDRTLWCGNLPDEITQELLYELFLQAGPLQKITIPRDNASGKSRNYAFIEFRHKDSVPYAVELMNGIQLFGQSLQLKPRAGSSHEGNSFHRSLSAPTMSNTSLCNMQGNNLVNNPMQNHWRSETQPSVYDRLGKQHPRDHYSDGGRYGGNYQQHHGMPPPRHDGLLPMPRGRPHHDSRQDSRDFHESRESRWHHRSHRR